MASRKTRLRFALTFVDAKGINEWFDKHPEVIKVHALNIAPFSHGSMWGPGSIHRSVAMAIVYEERVKKED